MADWPTRTAPSGAVVISPQGRLNMVAATKLREQLHAQIRSGNARLVIDLAGVDLIHSSGLSALVSGLDAARQAGGDLRLATAGEQVVFALELTKLNRVLKTYDSADEAFDETA